MNNDRAWCQGETECVGSTTLKSASLREGISLSLVETIMSEPVISSSPDSVEDLADSFPSLDGLTLAGFFAMYTQLIDAGEIETRPVEETRKEHAERVLKIEKRGPVSFLLKNDR